jgi:hypothetical protein
MRFWPELGAKICADRFFVLEMGWKCFGNLLEMPAPSPLFGAAEVVPTCPELENSSP